MWSNFLSQVWQPPCGGGFITVLGGRMFGHDDIVLANRPQLIIGRYIGYNYTDIVNAPYGEHFRNVRKIGNNEIFSPTRLIMFLSIRKDEIMRLLRKLYDASSIEFAKVELRSRFSELSFNVIMRMVSGKRYFGEDEANKEATKFRSLFGDVLEYSGASNPGDFLPFLRLIDYNNYEKSLARISKDMDIFLQGLIDEHRCGKIKNTMIDHLLKLQES